MLIACPECERKVSDRAKACPDCGFPVAEHFAEQREAEARVERLKSRERVGEVDCPTCNARGFRYFEAKNDEGELREMFEWCVDCKHSGRVHQCRDTAGYYAVSFAALDAFMSGEIDEGSPGVTFVGTELVRAHRFDAAGEVVDDDDTPPTD